MAETTSDLTAGAAAAVATDGEIGLLESEQRLRLVIETAGLATWDMNLVSGEVFWNDRHFLLQGYLVGEVPPSYDAWLDRVHPDDREEVVTRMEMARNTREIFDHEFRVRWPDGSIRWLAARGRFFYNETGAPQRMIGAMADVSERHESEERTQLLMREIDHRAKNLLTIVQSMVSLTKATDVESYRAKLLGRLLSLSRAHELLSDTRWGGMDVRKLLVEELKPYLDENRRIDLEGPTMSLPPDHAQSLALCIHELATNAVKHGSLSVSQGTLQVYWANEDGELSLTWVERGGPPVVTPPHVGFGTRVLTRRLQPLHGRVGLDWARDGLTAQLTLPAANQPVL